MFRTLRTLVLVAGLFGFVGYGFAQDPVTERPGQSQPMPAPAVQKQAPAAAAKLIGTLEGREEGLATGPLAFQVYQGGKVVMIDGTKKPVQGSSKVNGKQIQIVFGNCVYEGTETRPGVLSGIGRVTGGPNAGKTWTFSVSLRSPVVGRTFAGQESLPGYGAVSFRFIDAKTVEMKDRDGAVRGTYLQNGLQVTMTFGPTVYTGDLRGDAISGSARDTKHNWSFNVNASK